MGNCAASRHAVSWVDGDDWGSPSPERGEDGEERKGVEVKIRITRRQLQELLEKAAGGDKELPVEKVLADIMNAGEVVGRHHQHGEAHWKPALQSIPEAVEL